ncbi:MAG TPA: class I SAM-dependent methyltransferase [Humisphaera sp.]
MSDEAGGPAGRSVEAREAAFWDRQAVGVSDAELRRPFAPSDAVARCYVERLGNLAGKRVLDVGCGTGDWAVFFARAGAEVWALDVSPESVAVTRRRAAAQGVGDRVHGLVASATETGLPDAAVDLVAGQDVVHHVEATPFARELVRVLRPGGRAVFSENCANNPLLMFARNRLCGRFGIPRWSSDDEYPLTRAKIAEFARPFAGRRVDFPDFLFFFYLNAKLFGYRSRVMNALCTGADAFVYRCLPFMRQYSYRQVLTLDAPRMTEPNL